MNTRPASCFVVALLFNVLLLSSCATKQNAPVIERTPPATSSTVNKTGASKIVTPAKDWRPDSHTVKKGDTLFSIGLQYGYDYKDIAQANNISAPYTIRIGQVLKLGTAKSNPSPTKDFPAKDSAMVVAPLKTEQPVVAATSSESATDAPLVNSPKATREVYTDEALAKSKSPAKVVDVKSISAAKPATDTSKEPPNENVKDKEASIPKVSLQESADKTSADAKSNEDATDWVWPTKGKVIAQFADGANNKGIDIAGVTGQPINAAGDGKVIYNGSDLRGYGKLVIIKHSKDVLSVYAHNSQTFVKEGQMVTKGQKIAEMGNTDTDKVKLHFEIRLQGKSVDPIKYLPNLQ